MWSLSMIIMETKEFKETYSLKVFFGSSRKILTDKLEEIKGNLNEFQSVHEHYINGVATDYMNEKKILEMM